MHRGHRCIVLYIVYALAWATASECRAQIGFASARSAGAAYANVAEVGEVENYGANPATLAFLSGTPVSVTHVQGSPDMPQIESFDFPIFSGQGIGIATSMGLSHGGTNVASGIRSGLRLYGGGLAIGDEVSPHLALGGLLGVQGEAGDRLHTPSLFSAIAILYVPTPDVSYAAVLNGVESGQQYTSTPDSLEAYPRSFFRSVQVALAMRFPSSSSLRSPFLVLTLANKKILGKSGLIYRAGCEILPADLFSLQVGYSVGLNTDGFSGGIGLVLGDLRLDYALSLEDVHGVHYGTLVYYP